MHEGAIAVAGQASSNSAWEMARGSGYGRRASRKNRAAAVALALALEILIVLGLLQLGAWSSQKRVRPDPITVQSWSADHPEAKKPAANRTAAPAKAVQAKPKMTPPVPPVIIPKTPPPMIEMSHDDFAAADISKFSSHTAAKANGSGKDSGSSYGPGEGPGGSHLFNAEWYVEPSPGALAYYLPHGAPPDSWATIACQTAPHYHVENCVGLSESPPGSGLAKALRLAAWQFQVRPPMLDGHALIGRWVRIRFDWTEREGK